MGLRLKPGTAGPAMIDATARIIAPDGTSSSAAVPGVKEGDWGYLMYPADFLTAPKVFPAGSYTLIWSKSRTGEFLACDGWLAR
ncbi:MAG: hypothetical protein NVSMB32_10530 [Actinomycetota bacterium]